MSVVTYKIEDIQDLVRGLRDSDSHICPADQVEGEPCTCSGYDEVIDELDELKLLI
jgi:hypothetical protein